MIFWSTFVAFSNIWTLKRKRRLFTNLYHKHGLSFDLHLEPRMETKIISIKKNHFQTYIFV